MHHLADLLATIPLPDVRTGASKRDNHELLAGCSQCDTDLVHDLGADLPAGHVHVWGGPAGAGKTAFLLCLLQGAAAQGRRVVYATYDLAPESLALRLLAMTAGVDLRLVPDPGGCRSACRLAGHELARAHAARAVLSELPFEVLPARGFSARSLQDRLARMPFRAGILAVDYLQGVIRAPGSELGVALHELSDMAETLHVAVVCAVRAGDPSAEGGVGDLELEQSTLADLRGRGLTLPDRVGWIAPLEKAGARRAKLLYNAYGETAAVPLHLDEATGSLGRAADA